MASTKAVWMVHWMVLWTVDSMDILTVGSMETPRVVLRALPWVE